jgi:hypothetical protein
MSGWRHSGIVVVAATGVAALVLLARWGAEPRVLDPEAPEESPDVAPSPAAALSLIAAPLTVPVAPLAAELEGAIPRRYGSLDRRLDVPGHDRTSIAFALRRGPLDVSFHGRSAQVATTVRYAMRAWYDPPLLPEMSGSCGVGSPGEDPRLRLIVSGPVTVGRDWRLKARSRLAGLRPASSLQRDRCTVTFLDIDVTDDLVDGARSFLDAHAEALDSAAAHVDLRRRFSEWWATLQEPIELADSLWLVMRPESVTRGSVTGMGDSIRIDLAMRARPAVLMGRRPSLPVVPLPPLDTGTVAPALDVLVDARAGYDAASRFLQRELGGVELAGMGRTVRLDSLSIFGIGGGRLALEVRVSGDVAARLFLTGTPHVDPTTGRISIPDLDFDVHTRDLVLATVSWLRADGLRQLLRSRAQWPGTDVLGWVRARLVEGLNRDLSDELRVSGEVDEVRILGVVATKQALVVRASARGTAALSVVQRGS